jgi:hypothetical protein
MQRSRNSLAAVVLAGLAAGSAGAEMHGHSHSGAHDHGPARTGVLTMPGLQGTDATLDESLEMEVLFRNFSSMSRTVEELPNGIRTVTLADDPEVLGALVSHVVGMIDRVDTGRDPSVFIQSPTLDILFERRATITTDILPVDGGIEVTQTSTDPEVVVALHIHAAEVSDMAARGMQAVHERMMQSGG